MAVGFPQSCHHPRPDSLPRLANVNFNWNNCTIHTSVEPCPMCTSAIYWSGIGKLAYALSKTQYYDIEKRRNPDWTFEMPAWELLQKGGRKVEVRGPGLPREASEAYAKILAF